MDYQATVDRSVSTGLLLRTRFQLENEFVFRPKHDLDKPPPRQPGDVYVVVAMIAGAVIGGSSGLFISYVTGSFPFFGIAAGTVVGGILGLFIGDWWKKKVIQHRNKVWAEIFKKIEKEGQKSKSGSVPTHLAPFFTTGLSK